MFRFLVTIGILCLSSTVFAGSGPLDGRSYCRTVVSGGVFGQPPGHRLNCISFADGIASDNSNTFFGNPPQRALYNVRGNRVTFLNSVYELSGDQTKLVTVAGSTSAGVAFSLYKKQ